MSIHIFEGENPLERQSNVGNVVVNGGNPNISFMNSPICVTSSGQGPSTTLKDGEIPPKLLSYVYLTSLEDMFNFKESNKIFFESCISSRDAALRLMTKV